MEGGPMDREKIEAALEALVDAAERPGTETVYAGIDRGRALLQAALDEDDAIVRDPLDVLSDARLECERQQGAAKFDSREAEAWGRAEDAIFDALNVATHFSGRTDTRRQMDRFDGMRDAQREQATADAS